MSLLELWCASKIIFKIFVLSLPFFTKAKGKKKDSGDTPELR
jgi:hypothetical protein